jgi:hypothetical protein
VDGEFFDEERNRLQIERHDQISGITSMPTASVAESLPWRKVRRRSRSHQLKPLDPFRHQESAIAHDGINQRIAAPTKKMKAMIK